MGIEINTPTVNEIAKVWIDSESNTWILACGEAGVDEYGNLANLAAYVYQNSSSIPSTPPAGAPTTKATTAQGIWEFGTGNLVPGAVCGPPRVPQSNILAVWDSYPVSGPVVWSLTTVPFKGVCNSTSTDTCATGSGSGDIVRSASLSQELAAEPTTLNAAITKKSGAHASLPDKVTLKKDPIVGNWRLDHAGKPFVEIMRQTNGQHQGYVLKDLLTNEIRQPVQEAGKGEPVYLVFEITNPSSTAIQPDACTLEITE